MQRFSRKQIIYKSVKKDEIIVKTSEGEKINFGNNEIVQSDKNITKVTDIKKNKIRFILGETPNLCNQSTTCSGALVLNYTKVAGSP